MAVKNIGSGQTLKVTVAQITNPANSYVGVAGGLDEILSVDMVANQPLLLAGQTARFSNVLIKVKGTSGNDKFTGTDNADSVAGGAGNDQLFGNGGDDTLDGGTGKDVMFGGAGNDTYVVDNSSDKVTEVSGAGTDTVISSINYKLGANLENLILAGSATNGAGNALNNVITGNAKANTLTGGSGNDTLDGGAGNDVLIGGTGNDTYKLDSAGDKITELSGEGTDTVIVGFDYSLAENLENLTLTGTADIDGDGNDADNVITGNAGDNVLDGGEGNDSLVGGEGDDVLLAGEGDDSLNGGVGSDVLSGGDGDNIYIADASDAVLGGAGSDTIVIDVVAVEDMVIDGGTSAFGTDAVVVPVYFDATHTSISTVNSALSTAHATDVIRFTQSGDFSNIEFSHIEQIGLDSGVSITLSSEQLDGAIVSLDLGATNPGLHFHGVAGGAEERVTVVVDYNNFTFTPSPTVVGGVPTTYLMGDFQLDDASIGDLFHDVTHFDDFNTNSTLTSYARADGSNSNDSAQGSKGVDNATLRLGDDTYYGNEGNDLLVGHQGADYLDGGAGNDIFNITGFQTGVFGISGKADDGNAEWIATGAKHDVIIGGEGTDTLRITSGAVDLTAGTVVLNDANFQSMEVVQIGGLVSRANSEDGALQLINDHYYFNASGTLDSSKKGGVDGANTVTLDGDNINVDASGVTLNGLKFEGNADNNTFIGTTQADVFIGNRGNDTLTGGGGNDVFQFGNVHTMTKYDIDGAGSNTVEGYHDVVTSLTGVDTITDFLSGTDKIALDNDQFTAFSTTGALADNEFVSGAGVTAGAGNHIVFDTTTGNLYYDADADGAGAAVQIATLTGVTSLSASDINVI